MTHFDWPISFKKKKKENEKITEKREAKKNSLGISINEFKEFIKKWKEENLLEESESERQQRKENRRKRRDKNSQVNSGL
ncbi:MAG: hypothetical protein ACFFFB_12680 [Candidatus Heimdallarchaeota archaeon]